MRHYTLAQVQVFVHAAQRVEAESDRRFALLVRAAVWADEAPFKTLLKTP